MAWDRITATSLPGRRQPGVVHSVVEMGRSRNDLRDAHKSLELLSLVLLRLRMTLK
jgi:hypothetical protein